MQDQNFIPYPSQLHMYEALKHLLEARKETFKLCDIQDNGLVELIIKDSHLRYLKEWNTISLTCCRRSGKTFAITKAALYLFKKPLIIYHNPTQKERMQRAFSSYIKIAQYGEKTEGNLDITFASVDNLGLDSLRGQSFDVIFVEESFYMSHKKLDKIYEFAIPMFNTELLIIKT